MAWRFSVDNVLPPSCTLQRPLYLFIPFLSQRARVYMDGRLIADSADRGYMKGLASGATVLALLPEELLGPGLHTLDVHLQTTGLIRGYLSPLYVGTAEELAPYYRLSVFLFEYLHVMVLAAQLLMALLALFVWLYRPGEPLFGWLTSMLFLSMFAYTALSGLRERMERQLRRLGIGLDRSTANLPEISGVTPTHALNVLRIMQEAVTNAIAHGKARHIRVYGNATADGRACLSIGNDGIPFSPQPGGHGLNNMQRRVGQLGGEIRIERLPGGSRLQLLLPLQLLSPPGLSQAIALSCASAMRSPADAGAGPQP